VKKKRQSWQRGLDKLQEMKVLKESMEMTNLKMIRSQELELNLEKEFHLEPELHQEQGL
jgi:hypothetical protein